MALAVHAGGRNDTTGQRREHPGHVVLMVAGVGLGAMVGVLAGLAVLVALLAANL